MSPSKDMPPPPTPAKIAIKGFSLSAKPKPSSSSTSKPSTTNFSLKPGAKPTPASTLGKRPRTTFGGENDSDEDTEPVKHEAVSGFGEGGAIALKEGEDKGKGVLVIKGMGNRDWRGEARARSGKDLLPKEARAQRDAEAQAKEGGKTEGVDVVNGNDGSITWGLSVRKRQDVEIADAPGEAVQNTSVVELVQAQTADEAALAALLGDNSHKGPALTIPQPLSEIDAYHRAVEAAPDVSTLEDYERVPVEEFGAALLRGMGWKGEKEAKRKDVKRRQNLLGLGAKELDGAEELGAWVQKSDVKRLKPGSGGNGHGRGERKVGAAGY